MREGARLGLLLALAVTAAGPAGAEIYRWVDAQGQVHFGQRPTAGAAPVDVRPQVIERDAATRAREQAAERFFDARREERADADRQAREARAARQQQCARLRERLRFIEQPGAFYQRGEEGERTYYSDARMEAERQKLRTDIEQTCRD